jgi:hypothetical protein
MKKYFVSILTASLALPIFFSSGLSVSATTYEDGSETNPFTTEEEALIEAQENVGETIYVEDGEESYEIIVEEEELANSQEPTEPIETTKPTEGLITPYVAVTDGPVYTWSYIATYKFNDRVDNLLVSKVSEWITRGLGSTITSKIPSARLKVIANGLIAKAAKSINAAGATSYWTVKKYKDDDKYNHFVKEDIKVYKNSARTTQAFSTFVVEKFTK